MFATFARYTLAVELLIGAQARVSTFFPSIHQGAMAKADGYKTYLPFLPGSTPTQHSANIGWSMLASGLALFVPNRMVMKLGGGVGMALAMMGVYAQSRMGVPFWLPMINTVLGASVLLGL